MNFIAAGLTNIGRRRESNQDSYRVVPDKSLFIVADGMGGHRGGDIASQMATHSMVSYFEQVPAEDDCRKTLPVGYDPELSPHQNQLVSAIKYANQQIFTTSMRYMEVEGMGTTVVCAFYDFAEQEMHIAHVGDSRAYLLRDGELKLLTMDHSLINDRLMVMPDLDAAQLQGLPSNVITRALGIQDQVVVDVQKQDIQSGDRLILCTDGLNGMVADNDIKQIAQSSDDVEQIANRLVDKANQLGGEDNVTVVAVQINA